MYTSYIFIYRSAPAPTLSVVEKKTPLEKFVKEGVCYLIPRMLNTRYHPGRKFKDRLVFILVYKMGISMYKSDKK